MENITPENIIEDTRIACDVCADPHIPENMSRYGSFENVCSHCIENEFYTCDRCSSHVLNDDTHTVRTDDDDVIYCTDCYENSTDTCSSCDEVYHETYIDSDGLCPRCRNDSDEDEEASPSIYMRQNSRLIEYCETQGKTIKSFRTYGVEIECDMKDYKLAGTASRVMPKTCGIKTDGSVKGDIPVEVVTAPLQGLKGEEYIGLVCDALAICNTEVNRSCGLHIHIEASDYLGNYEKMKALFLFYLYAEDVIYSFLPKSRWNNRYCRKLCDMYYPDEIEKVQNVSRFEEVYYREQNPMLREQKKRSHYDSTRYSGVNFHALLSNKNTLEIRSHSATVKANKIINWIVLHTEILDYIMNSENWRTPEVEILFSRENKLKERTRAFFEVIKVPDNVRDYFLGRQKKFIKEFGKDDSLSRDLTYEPDPQYTPEYILEIDETLFKNETEKEMFYRIAPDMFGQTGIQILKELRRRIRANREREEINKSWSDFSHGIIRQPLAGYDNPWGEPLVSLGNSIQQGAVQNISNSSNGF